MHNIGIIDIVEQCKTKLELAILLHPDNPNFVIQT